jgi:hypothetical protein
MPGCQVPGLAVGVNAGLLLSALVVCLSRIFSLSLLATVRGGTSFLCPKRQRNEAKKTLSDQGLISVHSVQFSYMGTPKARCSPEPRMCETLLLANSYTHTLRPQRSRASTSVLRTGTASRVFSATFVGGLVAWSAQLFLWARPHAFCAFVSWWVGDVVRRAYIVGGWLSADSAG